MSGNNEYMEQLAEESSTYYMVVLYKSRIVAIELEDHGDGDDPDVWRDLEAFDDREGTHLYDAIYEASVLNVVDDLGNSPYIITEIVRTAWDVEALFDDEE